MRIPITCAVVLGLFALPAAAATQGAAPFALEATLRGQNPPGGAPPDRFGAAVSMDLGSLAIGVPGRYGDDTQEVGSVLLFDRGTSGWAQTQVLRAPSDGADFDHFGAAVSKLGGYLAVGTRVSAGGTRGAYVYESQPGGFALAAHLTPPLGDTTYGQAVAISGDSLGGWLAVGAPGSDVVFLYERVSGTWTYRQTLAAGDPDPGAKFGTALALGGGAELLFVGAPAQSSVSTADAGAVYVFRRIGGTWAQEAKLTAPDAATGDAFGSAVAFSEGTLAVGSPADDAPGVPDRGTVHVFVLAGNVWNWQQALAPAPGAASAAFGTAVAVSYDRALVGAPGAALAGSGAGTGAVYPFARAAGTWSGSTPFAAGASNGGDAFGTAVALVQTWAAVGAPERVEATTEPAGAAYAFVAEAGGWTEEPPIVPDHGPAFMFFGLDVAVDGDTLAAGASGMSVPTGRAGGVFVFAKTAPGWGAPQRLAAADGLDGDQLGRNVALDGDTLLAGAPGKNVAGLDSAGGAYVFRSVGGVWSEEQALVAPDPSFADYFGWDVAVSGDTAVVGAFFDSTPPLVQHGSAYVFVRSGSSWSFQQKLTASDPANSAGFGFAVAIEGDTVAIGARGVDAVYMFRRTGAAWNQIARLQAPDAGSFDGFGTDVSLSGSSLAIGAPGADAPGVDSGAVYVFVEGSGGWAFQQKLVPSMAGAGFGSSIALSGARLLGAWGTAPSSEAVHVFERTGSAWTQQPDILPPTTLDTFGVRVATDGPVAVVVAGTTATPVEGMALVYRKAEADLEVTIDDGQTAAVAGAPITYQVVARHGGGDPVAGARVTTPAPFVLTGATWTCAPSPGASCSASGSGPLDDLASLVARASATYTITGTVPSNLTGTLTTSARVTAPAGVVDPDPTNDAAQDVDVLSRVTDLAVALGSEPTAVGAGALVTWTTDVTNFGPSDSSGAVLVHDLADHATLVSVDPPPPACVASAGSVTCALGPLAASGVRRLTVVQRADAGYLGPIVAQSTVTAAETDPVSANDQRQLQVEVIPPGDAEVAHGTSLLTTVGAAGRRYRLSQRPYASYEAVVDAASGDLGDNQGPVLTLETATSTVVAASQPVGLGFSRTLRFRNDASTVVDDRYVRVASQGCSTSCGDDDVFRLRVYETTLYGPRFNNTGGQGTVLVLQTSGAAPVSGRAHFWSAGGTLLATAPFDLAPRGSLALATATVPGLAGQSGTLTVSHDGAYGAVTGKTVALVPETGASFDTPLSYRGR